MPESESSSAARDLAELQQISERLLLVGLRERERAAEARRVAELLEEEALHDALTSLPTRALFQDRLEQLLLAAPREQATFAVLSLDLDRFKAINDRLGHHAGDLLLQRIAHRLRGALRDSDTVARLHGDEFAVLLPGSDALAAERLARRLLATLEPPYALSGQIEHVGASIGVAVYPEHGSDADALMQRADAAMYAAKRAAAGYAIAGQTPEPHDFAPHAEDLPDPAPPASELQQINERLLLASLREHDIAAQLDRQLAFTGAITASLGEGVVALDHDGLITFVNPAAARLLGWPAPELIGQEVHTLLPAPHAADPQLVADQPLLAALHSGTAVHRDDAAFVRRDGAVLPVEYTATPLLAIGQITGLVVAFRDIAARRSAESERARVLAQVNAALAFRTRFLAITAHELKTPLTVIKGHAQLLHRRIQTRDEARVLASLDAINRQSDRMAQLIDDLVDVARLTTEDLALDMAPVNLNALLAETVAEVEMLAPTFVLRLDQQAHAVAVSGDRPRLQQVLLNLLLNAVKYAGQRLEVEVSLRQDGDRAVIAITDYGRGIPAAQQDAVFEPYFRAANATADRGNSQGLGLFISKAIIDRHAGTLGLVSVEGAGSTFSVALPLLPG